jgi:hypothetical protein
MQFPEATISTWGRSMDRTALDALLAYAEWAAEH